MDRGLYIAASGMLAELQRQNQLANDLANAATPGYKSDRSRMESFGTVLLRNTRDGTEIGELDQGVRIGAVVTDLRPQALRDTGEPLDLAIAGEGFFAVRTGAGVRYTRNGEFVARSDGTLADQLGNPVLGPTSQPVRANADGTVATDAVGVFLLRDAAKAGDGMFTGRPAGVATAADVQSGKLEASGIDEARTTIDMMASMRAFQAAQKAIQTIDATLGQAAGTIGRLP